MLMDDIELLSGKMINGDITPALFLILKPTAYMRELCHDLGMERMGTYDTTQRETPQQSKECYSRASLEKWLAITGEPVTL